VLRRAEDGGAYMHKRHMDPMCMAWEQAVYNDIWPSLLLGTPVSRGIASMWWGAGPGNCAGCGCIAAASGLAAALVGCRNQRHHHPQPTNHSTTTTAQVRAARVRSQAAVGRRPHHLHQLLRARGHAQDEGRQDV
jgi:hypothetical protein